ncbi:hypothetical protein E5D57_002134 [Metarhizium anisopliae]|nr:hypothetical protein E5D57_002134 [Metarhizium anisopliae]
MNNLGCTLWSSIPNHAYDIVQLKINDFSNIDDWNPQKHDEIHQWRRTLHLRSNNPWTAAFAADLITQDGAQDGLDHVKVCAFGHTHYSTDIVRNGIRIISNRRGYVAPGSTSPGAEHRNAGDASHDFDITMTVTL